ncbi:MAG: adenosylcobinamide-phosphate synthase CbiB [Pseudomonadota bacterium]
MSGALLMLLAWGIEVLLGWPDAFFKRIRHPVVWIGALISVLDRALNRSNWSHRLRYVAGVMTALVALTVTSASAMLIAYVLPNTVWGMAIEAVIASSLLASRSLYTHVAAVATRLVSGDLAAARQAVAKIVGRDPDQLDEAGIARASLESLAENLSDGVVAPLFWGVIGGLPGLAAYKTINTLDSTIGHRNDRYAAFGGFAARLDDLANLIPARLTAFLIATSNLSAQAFRVAWRDARHHRSPNAGWPEAALAGVLDIRLSGPRAYADHISQEPWLNTDARDPDAVYIAEGLRACVRALGLAAAVLGMLTFGGFLWS